MEGYKNETEKNWTEQVFPHIKQFQDKCRELGIEFEWKCIIRDETFGGSNNSQWRKPNK